MILKGISVNQNPPTKDYLWITPKGNTRFWNQSTWMLIGGNGGGGSGNLPVIESAGKYLVTTGTAGNYSLAWGDINLSNYINGTSGYAAIFNSSNSIISAIGNNSKMRIGDGIIEWDSTNNGFKIYNATSTQETPTTAGIYADWVSALGPNSSGGGGGGSDLDWGSLITWDEDPTHIINIDYLPISLNNGVITIGNNSITPVTSVAMTVPTGFTINGSPITKTGTLALGYNNGYEGFTTDLKNKINDLYSWFEVDNNGNVKTKDKPNNGGHRGFYSESFISALGLNSSGGGGGGGISETDLWIELTDNSGWLTTDPKIIARSHLPINGTAANSGGQTFYAPISGGSNGQYLRWPSSGSIPYWDTLDASDIPNLSASKINSGTFDAARIPTLSITDKTSGTLPVNRGGTGLTSLTSGYALIGNGTNAVSLRAITNNTSASAVTASTNLITANTLYYHKGNSNIVNVGTITSGTWNGTTIGTSYGGTGKTSWDAYKVLYASAANTLGQLSHASSTSYLLKSGSSSAAPSWIQYASNNVASTIVQRDSNGYINATSYYATNNKANSVTASRFIFTDTPSTNYEYAAIFSSYENYGGRINFRQWSGSSSARTSYCELYQLPKTNASRTGTGTYNILTSKDLSFSITGNAATATILQTTRTINGTNFNGSADITTSTWGTARNISISDTDGTNTGDAVSVNGSENKTLKLPSTIKASLNGTVNGYSISSTINSGTANRLAYYTSSGIDDASTTYVSNTKLAINSTSEPSYNLYANGTSYFNGNVGIGDILQNIQTLILKSSQAQLRLISYSNGENYIESGNTSWDTSANLHISGYNDGSIDTLTLKATSTYISGNVGIGINTPNSDCKLHVVGNIYATGGVTALQTVSSDKRLKKNIKKFNAKDIVDKLNPVSFEWNSKAKKLSDFKDGTNYGLIAQDSDGIIDNLVFDLPDGKGYKGVRYEKLIPILLQAVKEQQKEIDELKQIIKKLKV